MPEVWKFLPCKVLWAALDIGKNICFHFRIGIIMEKFIEFILGDKLPWVCEAVIAIYGYSPGG